MRPRKHLHRAQNSRLAACIKIKINALGADALSPERRGRERSAYPPAGVDAYQGVPAGANACDLPALGPAEQWNTPIATQPAPCQPVPGLPAAANLGQRLTEQPKDGVKGDRSHRVIGSTDPTCNGWGVLEARA